MPPDTVSRLRSKWTRDEARSVYQLRDQLRHAVAAAAAAEGMRADHLANLMAVWKCTLSTLCPRGTMLITVDTLMERTGLSRRTVQSHRAWLRASPAASITVIERGRSPKAVRIRGIGQFWPARAEMWWSPTSSQELDCAPPLDAVQPSPSNEDRGQSTPTKPKPEPKFPLRTAAKTRAELLDLAARVRAELGGVLMSLSVRYVAYLLRSLALGAGWTAADLIYAVDHGPDGKLHGWTHAVRVAAGWLRHRLDLWTGHDAPHVAAERARAKQRNAAALRAEQAAAAELAKASPSARAAAIAEARAAVAAVRFNRTAKPLDGTP